MERHSERLIFHQTKIIGVLNLRTDVGSKIEHTSSSEFGDIICLFCFEPFVRLSIQLIKRIAASLRGWTILDVTIVKKNVCLSTKHA